MPATPHVPGDASRLRFADLVRVDHAPPAAQIAQRRPIDSADPAAAPVLADNPRNSGFVTGLFRRRRVQASRRTFLRGSVTAAAASAAAVTNLFGPARTVEAQTGVIGTYPRRILQYCPPYNSQDNCQPGCGSSPICTDCCTSDGYFRNDPANGYSLYPGGCGDGDIADGWLWRYAGLCGNCSTIEYRCSDGYVQTDTGPAPFVCRWVVDCVPLAEGQEPGQTGSDAARSTNWRPAGGLELAIDNGGTVSMTGWVADGSGSPVDIRIRANNTIVHLGRAAVARPDVAARVRGAGSNTGFSVTFPLETGQYQLCVDALAGVLTKTMGCVNLEVGSGRSVRGSVGNTTLPNQPAADPDADPRTDDDAQPAPDPTPSPVPVATLGALDLPDDGEAGGPAPFGIVEVLRRSGDRKGFASGWLIDPTTTKSAYVEVLVGGLPIGSSRTTLARPDVQRAFPNVRKRPGFAVSFPLPSAEVEVCVEAISADGGSRIPLGCRRFGAAVGQDPAPEDLDGDPDSTATPEATATATPAPTPTPQAQAQAPEASSRRSRSRSASTVYGRIEHTAGSGTRTKIRGWAFDRNDADRVIEVTVAASGITAATAADRPSPEVTERFGIERGCSFELMLALDPGVHRVELRTARSGLVLDTVEVRVE